MTLVALGTVIMNVPLAGTAGAIGPTFVPTEAPLPANAGPSPAVSLGQPACATDSTCIAVGSYDDVNGAQQILIETYASGGWTAGEGALPADAPSNPEASLGGVSCPAPGACTAVGSYTDDQGDLQPLIETLANGAWTPSEAMVPPGASADPDGQLNAVSCASTVSCIAVGSYDAVSPTSAELPLIDTFSGGAWTPEAGPLASDGTQGVLNGVSCPVVGACVAVGVYGVAVTSDGLENQDTLPLVDTLSSGTWAPSEGAVPVGSETSPADSQTVEMFAVSCGTVGQCQAVGTYDEVDGNQVALAENLASGNWSVGTLSLPSDASITSPVAALRSVSCLSGGPCMAVGDYSEVGGNQQALNETQINGTWTSSPTPVPPTAGTFLSAVVDGVTCTSSGTCGADGSYQDASGDTQGFMDLSLAPAPVAPPAIAPPAAPAALDPTGIASGPDGALWFTNRNGNSIGRISTTGAVTEFTDPSIQEPDGIALGPDGALWFTNEGNDTIGRITAAGVISRFNGASVSDPRAITAGPDGAMWFVNAAQGTDPSIGRIAMSGAISNYPTGASPPTGGITAGPDGAMWFVSAGHGRDPSIDRLAMSGALSSYPTGTIGPTGGITAGPDGALWFTSGDTIGRITIAGVVSSYGGSTIDGASAIATGPDGALWFTNLSGGPAGGGSIGRISTSGSVTNFTSSVIAMPRDIATGPDGALWFTGQDNAIGRISTTGVVAAFGEGASAVTHDRSTTPDGGF